MALVTFKGILPQARRDGRAVGAFNVANYETAVAVVEAAEAERQPVIIQLYQRLMDDRHVGALVALLRRLAEDCPMPVAVHLDHGASVEQLRRAIDIGFSSVMFDGSTLPWEENLALTQEAAALARKAGVSLEAEIGHVAMGDATALSTPDEAGRFAAATGVDTLAVSVGTAHGYYKEEPRIDLELAAAIGRRVAAPLVLHGGSGTPMEMVKGTIRAGFAKINVATEFQHCFQLALEREMGKQQGKFLPFDKLAVPAVASATEFLRGLIRAFANPR